MICSKCQGDFKELIDNSVCIGCFSDNEVVESEELALMKKLLLWPEHRRKKFIELYLSSDKRDNDKSVNMLFGALFGDGGVEVYKPGDAITCRGCESECLTYTSSDDNRVASCPDCLSLFEFEIEGEDE